MSDLKSVDLLAGVGAGGCSAKIPPEELDQIVGNIDILHDEALIVGTETSDDAAVWKMNAEEAIIQTTDFFPPMCSDPYEFGQIAAANALSDVFAMGGRAIMAMNIVLFPAKWDLAILEAILKGGAEKVKEAGAVLCGGHTIDDATPKYGLAVTGLVHPDRVTTNAGVQAGDVFILTKPIGTGIILAGKKLDEVAESDYRAALESMKQLNKVGAELMQKYQIKAATDVTGFGLLGHALKMAKASNAQITFNASAVPLLSGVRELADLACFPGALFKNLKYIEPECAFSADLEYSLKMTLLDAQTSGGLLISVPSAQAEALLAELKTSVYPHSAIIGHAEAYQGGHYLHIEA